MRSLPALILPLFSLLLLCLSSCARREIDVRVDDAAMKHPVAHLLCRLLGTLVSLFLCLLVMAPFFDPVHKVGMPEEEAYRTYLRSMPSFLTRLQETAAGIRTQEEADAAAYALAALAGEQAETFRAIAMESLWPTEAGKRARGVLRTEEELMQSEPAARFLREDKRLRESDFYGSATLRYLWQAYAAIDTPQGVLLPWMPSTRLRLAADGGKTDSQPLPFPSLFEAADLLRHPSGHEDVTLLALDALATAPLRASDIGEGIPLRPCLPVLRGEHELFGDCFCPRYCFVNPDDTQQKALSGEPAAWASSSPLRLAILTKEAARALPALQEERRTEFGTTFIYRLTPPFRSAYLLISFDHDDEHPGNFVFTDDISGFTHFPADDAS